MGVLDMSTTSISHPRRKFRFNIAYLILTFGSLIALLPFVWMLLSSFKTLKEIRQIPPTFFPQGIFYRNSAIIAIANVIQVLFTSSLFGYIFAKFEFKGKNALFWFIMSLMMIPSQMTMIPGYLILAKLKLINNLLGLIIPAAIDAFGIFLFRQFALSIPNELLDAARVDGAGEFYIYWRIVLPQLGPALATFGMLTFMFNWNAYLWPLIVLTEKNVRTLPIILTWFSNQMVDKTNLTMAASVLVIIPVLVVFLFVQRWIVEGITLSGMKG